MRHTIIFCKNQYRFRPKFSTYIALHDWRNKTSEAVDNKRFAFGIFIDLSKAFGWLNHSILLSKLEHYGIRGITLNWFRNYLFNPKYYVCVDNLSSRVVDVECGIPQGSILGLILFNLYIK